MKSAKAPPHFRVRVKLKPILLDTKQIFNLPGKTFVFMEAPIAIQAKEQESTSPKEGKKKKEEKMDLTLDKLELSLYRAQLAMVRTASTTTTLGFALYKLLDEKVHDGINRPILSIFTPRLVALILFFSGFLGLVSYSFRHVSSLKKIGRFAPKFFYSGVMLVSYTILLLTVFLFIGALINP